MNLRRTFCSNKIYSYVSFGFVCIIFVSKASAQVRDTSLTGNNAALTSFEQNLTTLDWNGIASLNQNSKFGDIGINEVFHSVLINGTQKSIRDEQAFDGAIQRDLGGDIYAEGMVRSNVVSDNREIGLNSVGASSVLGGVSYVTVSDTLWGRVGNQWDRQAGVNNSGLRYSIYGAAPFSIDAGSTIFPSLNVEDEQILPRRNYDHDASVIYRQKFSPEDSLDFSGTYTSQLRGFYFVADSTVQRIFGVTNNIQNRLDNQSSFSVDLSFPIIFFQMTTHGDVSQRQIDFTNRYKPKSTDDPLNNLYDTRIKVFNFELGGQMKTGMDADSMYVSMSHSERNETHAVINFDTLNSFTLQQMSQQFQLNNLGSRNTLAGEVHLEYHDTKIDFTGLASIFHYDTPDSVNYDDRDELTNTLALTLGEEFSPSLHASVGLEADLIHIVYLESQRSANNNRNFIYRLFPTIIFSQPDLYSANKFEVLANYTAYDYEAFSQVHSYSFRQASFLDSTYMKLTSKISALFFGDLKLYSRGELYWSNFSEYPLNYFIDRTIWFMLYYGSRLYRCGIGYKYLALSQYNYTTATSRQLASEQTNSGPTASIELNMSHLELMLNGWYQVSWQSSSAAQIPVVYPNFELSARYNL